MRELDRLFGGRVLAMSSDQRGLRGRHWAARSPDPDFALWPIAKSNVYSPMPKSLDELEARIKTAFEEIDATPGLIER